MNHLLWLENQKTQAVGTKMQAAKLWTFVTTNIRAGAVSGSRRQSGSRFRTGAVVSNVPIINFMRKLCTAEKIRSTHRSGSLFVLYPTRYVWLGSSCSVEKYILYFCFVCSAFPPQMLQTCSCRRQRCRVNVYSAVAERKHVMFKGLIL